MKRLAIVGSGVAGMACIHYLQEHYDITVLEKNDYIGGHTNTIDVKTDTETARFDTGFMVFNFETYPNLIKFFDELKVDYMKTDMSFSVQNLKKNLEYNGSALGFFAQKKNFFSPAHYLLISQIFKFNKLAHQMIEQGINRPELDGKTILDFKKEHGFTQSFFENYLIPMSGAIWSTPYEEMLKFPIATMVQFFYNHGLLGVTTQHQWYTVTNGSRSYRDKILDNFKGVIKTDAKVDSVEVQQDQTVKVTLHTGEALEFDEVILASHADESLGMLKNPTSLQKELLQNFKYQENMATIHTDDSVMPKNKVAWSAWNFRYNNKNNHDYSSSTTYWMNKLQSLDKKNNYYVTINDSESIDESKVLKKILYHHPLFDTKAIEAQKRLPELNQEGPVYFTGSYFRYGFHEDAFSSSKALCMKLLQVVKVS